MRGTILLLRHASAGERVSPQGADRARPLDAVGRKDARDLVRALSGYAIEQVVSSPHARCLQTVEPLARRRRVEIETREELCPDTSVEEVARLLAELPERTLVCTHREVIARLFGAELTCEKGGTWLLERPAGEPVPVAYLPPPSNALAAAPARALLPGT